MSSTVSAKKIWTILELISWGTEYLTEKKIDDARLNIELLLAHVLHLKRIQLYTSFDKPLSEVELSSFKQLLQRRLANEPLQYVLGETEFMGLKFFVDKNVLIPRPETELLVEKAIATIKERFENTSSISVLDIGTGSGCIAISLAKMVPNANIIAIDVSQEALSVAQKNATLNNVSERIQFQQMNIFEITEKSFSEKFHCIISNPPYISKKEFGEVANDVRDFEPHSALTDEHDGLTFYPTIAKVANEFLIENGILCVEHAFDQSENVQKIFQESGFSITDVVKDYQKISRHVFAERK